MGQKEYQIDYSASEEPLVILPLCVGVAVLHGAFFRWFSRLDRGGDKKLVIFMKLLYWSAVIGAGGIAAWRLIRTIHATSNGLEYRFLGKTRKIIPWNEFSCACKCRTYYRNDMIYLIPKSCGLLSEDRWVQYQFSTRNHWKLIHFHPTKNNLRAIGTFLTGL